MDLSIHVQASGMTTAFALCHWAALIFGSSPGESTPGVPKRCPAEVLMYFLTRSLPWHMSLRFCRCLAQLAHVGTGESPGPSSWTQLDVRCRGEDVHLLYGITASTGRISASWWMWNEFQWHEWSWMKCIWTVRFEFWKDVSEMFLRDYDIWRNLRHPLSTKTLGTFCQWLRWSWDPNVFVFVSILEGLNWLRTTWKLMGKCHLN